MESLLELKKELCTSCLTCVRTCPVKAIHIHQGEKYPVIIDSQCIGCGQCVIDCDAGAIKYFSYIDRARTLFKAGEKIAVIISPSISAEFYDISDYRKFITMIRALGASYVNEMAFAVDVLAYKYINLFNDFKGRYYITSNDPVVVEYITKYHPNLISNLAPLLSPMIIMTKIVRKMYGPDVKVIYVGPGIAIKREADEFENECKIDAVLTFQEIRELFAEYNIDESNFEFSQFDPPLSYKGSLYPLRNGLIQAGDMDENSLTSNVISVEGKKEMIDAVKEFEKNITSIGKHFYITSGNFMDGPGMTKRGSRLFKENHVIDYVNRRLQNFFRVEWYNELHKYTSMDLSRSFTANDQRLPDPPEARVKEALAELAIQDNSYGCRECGYSSCIDLAKDIARGITIPQMCITYYLKNHINYEESVRELNEKLATARKALSDAEEKSIQVRENATQASDLTNAVMEKLRSGVVIVDNHLKIVKANSPFATILGDDAMVIRDVIPDMAGADLNQLVPPNFVNLFSFALSENESIESRDLRLGDNLINVSVFPLVKGKIAGGIIRDMQAPEVQKTEVMNRITDVIDRNLEMVQKIGYLLGEGATDIERMLNSIIEFYKGKSKK